MGCIASRSWENRNFLQFIILTMPNQELIKFLAPLSILRFCPILVILCRSLSYTDNLSNANMTQLRIGSQKKDLQSYEQSGSLGADQ